MKSKAKRKLGDLEAAAEGLRPSSADDLLAKLSLACKKETLEAILYLSNQGIQTTTDNVRPFLSDATWGELRDAGIT